MKVSAWKRKQRHLRARRAYWEQVYSQGGLRRVPMPFVERYNEEGEIVPMPPLECKETPLRNLVLRLAGPSLPVMDWKIAIDPTLPANTIKVGNVTLSGIGEEQAL